MKKCWNNDWRFALTEIGEDSVSSVNKRSDWQEIALPHDWLIYDTTALYKDGEGWYKKTLVLTAEKASKRVSLRFDGVYMNCEVYVNGESAGIWRYGYTTFELDISALVREGENTVLVRVRHESPNTRWYSGAGIYRDVWLCIREESHFLPDGIYIHAAPGESGWTVTAEAEVGGGFDVIRHTVIDMEDNEVAQVEGGLVQSLCIKEPILWDTDKPYHYRVISQLIAGGIVADYVVNPLGFRTTEFSPTEGFKLNGRRMKLHGVCLHHDHGALGAAFNKNAMRRQLEIMQGMGVNAIRTSHNPPAPAVMDLCDELGILVVSEIFDMWELPKTENDYARFFPEWYKKDVASWIRRDRNHPSVILWSIGNEIYDTHKDLRGVEVARALRDEVLRHDPRGNARPTIGSNYMTGENAQRVSAELILAGYNYAEYLYDEHHEKYPDWFIYGSETASTVRSRGVYHFPLASPLLTCDDLQCSDLGNSVVGWGGASERTWVDDRDRAFCGGQFIWTGFDYIGEPTPYSTKNSYFGIVDTAGFPKASYYFYKAVWNKSAAPFVKLFPHWDWNEGQLVDVICYTNAPEAELFLNGVSLGRRVLNLDRDNVLHMHWQAVYAPGEIVVRAYKDGEIVAEDRKITPGEPAKIVLTHDEKPLYASGTDLKYVEITVADKNGNPVENARSRIRLDVSGSAFLAGLDNGDSTDYDSYKGRERALFSGKLVAILQSTDTPGEARVKFTGEGLEGAELGFTVLPYSGEAIFGVARPVVPAYAEAFSGIIPVRKIELSTDRTALDEAHTTAAVTAKILPENATHRDIIWKCMLDTGVETNIAEVTGDGEAAVVTAKGDGAFRLRAMARNGKPQPEVLSEISFTVSGLGEAVRSPYRFTSASLYAFSNRPLNIIERGAIGGIRERTVIGFTSVDFGRTGSRTLRLHLGNCTDTPVPVEVYLGDPDGGGTLVGAVDFPNNHLWDRFAPHSFDLPKTITGMQDIAFVVGTHCIFGGFDFVDTRAFAGLMAAEYDSVYGDEFTLNGGRIDDIGNNVVIGFKALDFGEGGAGKITIRGKTPNEKNTITMRIVDGGGSQATHHLEFTQALSDEEQVFDFGRVNGVCDVSFVFLPGSRFGFDGFRFE